MDTVRFFAANTQPNPVEVDYWVDLYDNPYGGSIKYYNGTEWVRLAASGGIPDLSKYYTKVQVNLLLNNKASVLSVESKVDDEEVKDVIKNITFRTSNPNEVQMVLAKYDTTTVAISLPKASDVSAGIVTSDDFRDFVKQVDLQQLYQELYDSNSSIMNAINDIKAKYQKKLIAGSNIKISDDNVISAIISIEGGDIDVDGINSKIDELTGKLQEEVTRSTNADNKLTRDLSTESTTARAAEKKNADNIASNTQAIQKEVTDRNAAIKVETDRATAAENKLASDIVTTVETEKDRAEGVELVIINDLAEEVTRAKAAEQANKTAINKEVTDRQSAIATEVDNRNAAIEVEKQRALKAEAALDSKIATHTNEINTALATKADKSTTYNKTEVDSKVSTINQTKQDKLTAGSGIKIENNTISSTLDVQLYKIVDSLPTLDVEPGKIYLVLSETTTESNKYTEYVYVNGEWEIMGSYTANVDLSSYLTKTDAASTYQPKGNYALKTEIPDVSTKADTSYVNAQIQTVNTEINKKANKADLHAVATSGNYNDLTNKLKAGIGVTITDDNTINTSVDLSGVTNSISELDSKIEAEISRATIAESNKVDKIVGKGLSTNDYTTNEKNKLAGIASGAEVNVQSDWNQTDINSDDYIKNKPVAATTSKDGFMSAADKTKLDGIAEGANAYTLPAATAQTLGGVKIGSNISLADGGVISINKTNVTTALGYTPLESVDTSNFVTLSGTQTIAGKKTFSDIIYFNQLIQGNVLSASKLQTARLINGTDFNGSASITTSKWGISRNLTIGKTTKAVDGSANVNYTVEDIGLSKLTLSIGDSITEYDGTADKTIEIPSGGGIDALPVNTILRSTAEAGNVFGEGWLPCDGSTVSSKDYPLLNCLKVVIPTKAYKGTDGKTFAKQLGYSDVYNDILCVTTTSNSYNDVVLAKTSEVIYRILSSVNVTTVYDYYLIYRNYFIFGGTNDSDIYIVNLKDGKNTTTRISAGAVCRGIFNIDDKIIVFTSAAIRSLDLQTNSLTNVVKRPVGSVLVHFPYDNSFLYSGSGANGMYLSSYDAEPIETHIPYAEVGKELITKGKLGIAYNNNAANTIYIIKNPSDDTSKWQKVNVTDDATRCIYTNDIFLHIASEGTNQTQDFVNWYQTSNDFSANSLNFSLDTPIMKGPENILYYCGNSYVVEATINNVLPVLENRYIKTYIGQSQEYVGKLTINMISNQSTSDASLVGTIVKVYDNTMSLIDERTWQGLAYTLDVLPNIEYTIVATSTNGVSQDPVTVTLTNNEVKTVTITYNFEKLVIQAYEKEQISTRATITVKYNDKVLATSSNGKLTAYIAYGTVYVITYGDLEELAKPKDVEYTASLTTREINAVYDDYKPDYITIDQTITDPNTMISGDVNGATLQWIRNNTHRYISKNTGDGLVTICQLSDDDTAKFYDGITDSTIYIEDTDYNVFVRIPRFWYKAIETTTDVWKIGFSKKLQDGTWKEWDGNDLIGAYEAYFNNLHLYSVSNKASSGDISLSALTSHARNNGTGYTLVKWKHHCIVGVLYYALYGNTNCQATIGSGTDSYTKNTGTTNNLGMHDTSASGTGNSNSINFLGLENWWGNKYEFIDNVVFNKSSASYKYTISEDDGSTREIETTTSTSWQYPKVMVFGENLDLAMKRGTSSASTTTGFCDGLYISSSTNRVVVRSCSNSNANEGVAYLYTNYSASDARPYIGSRLAFRGTIIEEKNIETFKAL